MKKSLVVIRSIALVVLLMASRIVSADTGVSWSAPSSVRVGQSFSVYGYYNSRLYYVDTYSGPVSPSSDGHTFRATAAGTISFGFRYMIGSQYYWAYTTVTAVADTPTLGSVVLSIESPSAAPGDIISCSLYAYSTQGTSITGGTKSWEISSSTNDIISTSGLVSISTAQVSRTIIVTGTYRYNGVTKSGTAYITVTRLPIVLEDISISAPTNIVYPGDSVSLSLQANSVSDGPITDGTAVWSVLANELGDYVSSSGVVSISTTNISRKVRVVCDYTYNGVTKSDMIELSVKSKCDIPVISPENGTVFTSSLSISMSCGSEGSIIRYTKDGSVPSEGSPVYAKFKIYGKTTIMAAAFNDDGSHSDIVTASYALGQCADPIVSPTDGTVFKHSGQVVSIAQNGEEGVLRYTVDGSDPTSVSAIYTGPFMVDDSVVVKAKVFSDNYFDSAVVTVNLTREWETVATPVVTAGAEFTGRETEVVIACSTPGATIRYTTNGDEPTSHSPKYTGSFWVSKSCTIKAVAMCADYLMSAIASRTVTKVWGIGDTMGAPDHAFTTSGDVGFTRVDDATATGGEAMRSGAIGNSAGYGLYTRSVLSTTVHGPGTLTFKWRASCEQDDDYEWDHAEFAVDGVVTARINDVTEWREVEQPIIGSGEHVVTWTYLKDDSEGAGDDCLWVSDYSWVTDEPYTHESSVPVPYNWICSYFPHTAPEYDRLEATARKLAANGVDTVEEAYIAGLNPTNQVSRFAAKMELRDGVPVVMWEPDLNESGTKSERLYKVYGKESLSDVDWVYPTNSLHRFFKVTVEMP